MSMYNSNRGGIIQIIIGIIFIIKQVIHPKRLGADPQALFIPLSIVLLAGNIKNTTICQ